MVTRHRKGLKRGLSVAEAAETPSLPPPGRAVVFAGATVCIALLGMLILRLGFLNGVAIAASLTVILTVAASVTLLPALLSFIGMGPCPRRERRRLTEHGPQPELPTGFAARWSAFVERHQRSRRSRRRHARPGAADAVAASRHLTRATTPARPPPARRTPLAEGFGPGVNGPLTVVAELDGARRPGRHERVARPRCAPPPAWTPSAPSPTAATAARRRSPSSRTPHPSRSRPATSSSGCAPTSCPPPSRAPHWTSTSAASRPRTTTSRRSSSASCRCSSASSSPSAACCSYSPSGPSASR
nr:MMPL family transporter [Streptomyces sp. CC228A]